MKTRYFLISAAVLICHLGFGQALNLHPHVQEALDFSPEAIAEYESCLEILASSKTLTPKEKKIIQNCDETKGIWDTESGGCSWYCGAGRFDIRASSRLRGQGGNNYYAKNAHDFSYKTAWVEGVSGYGIGEYLLYTFEATHPRITTIKIANGYVKSERAYYNNSRVKTLNMYVNDTLFAYLNLKDVYAEQHFLVAPIGHGNRQDLSLLEKKGNWTIKFEIAEVYKGDKYDDTVISEIFFDGLDVHCFAVGTMITMADSSHLEIEKLSVGQKILSFNQSVGRFETAEITELAQTKHSNLVKIYLENGTEVVSTADHPFLSKYGWLSVDPTKTQKDYMFDDVFLLEVNKKLTTQTGLQRVTKIEVIPLRQDTYTIAKLNRNNTFIANGIVVGTEELRKATEILNTNLSD